MIILDLRKILKFSFGYISNVSFARPCYDGWLGMSASLTLLNVNLKFLVILQINKKWGLFIKPCCWTKIVNLKCVHPSEKQGYFRGKKRELKCKGNWNIWNSAETCTLAHCHESSLSLSEIVKRKTQRKWCVKVYQVSGVTTAYSNDTPAELPQSFLFI